MAAAAAATTTTATKKYICIKDKIRVYIQVDRLLSIGV